MVKAGNLGFLGVGVPEEYGGLGMPLTSSVLVCDYFSGSSGSTSTAFGAHTGTVSYTHLTLPTICSV